MANDIAVCQECDIVVGEINTEAALLSCSKGVLKICSKFTEKAHAEV